MYLLLQLLCRALVHIMACFLFSIVGVALCPLLGYYVEKHSFFGVYSVFVVALPRRFAARDLVEVLVLGALSTSS